MRYFVQALRLVLHSISTSATRYGRYIEPLLSLSIDFYVRIFVRVRTAAVEVKKVAMYVYLTLFLCSLSIIPFTFRKTSTFYICTSCEAFYGQPLGRVVEKVHEASGNVNYNYKTHAGPPVSQRCPECDSTLHVSFIRVIFYATFNFDFKLESDSRPYVVSSHP